MTTARPGRRTRVPGPQTPGLVSGIIIASGCWLLVHSFTDVYGIDGRWSDRLAGLAALVLGFARTAKRMRLSTATACGLAIGLWLLLAPFVLDYGFARDSTAATVTDAVAGAAIATLSLVGHVRAVDQSG